MKTDIEIRRVNACEIQIQGLQFFRLEELQIKIAIPVAIACIGPHKQIDFCLETFAILELLLSLKIKKYLHLCIQCNKTLSCRGFQEQK